MVDILKSKAIDKQAGVERKYVGEKIRIGDKKTYPLNSDFTNHSCYGEYGQSMAITAPSTPEAKQWQGYGTALKPATEFWTLARKPLSENTVAENVLKWGTGGINIDSCRIKTEEDLSKNYKSIRQGDHKLGERGYKMGFRQNKDSVAEAPENLSLGRFPANLILDEFMGGELDKQTGILTSGGANGNRRGHGPNHGDVCYGEYSGLNTINGREPDEGGASRFFYCAKADNFERNKGLKGFDEIRVTDGRSTEHHVPNLRTTPKRNFHPTVKPIDLMRYLVKLITPKGGIVLDPYCGSGTTCIGAKLELINYIGIERDEEYCKIAEARIAAWNPDKYKPQTLF